MELDNVEEILFLQIKATIRQSFSRLYAALKARELQTLRQLQAVHSHCESSHSHLLACIQSIQISYDVEPKILESISQFGEVKLDGVNFDGDTFLVEDYVNPNEDHMYCYKDLNELSEQTRHLDLDIEEAALRQVTKTENCVCSVNFTSEEIHKRCDDDDDTSKKLIEIVSSEKTSNLENILTESDNNVKVNDKIQENNTTDKLGKLAETSDETPKTDPTNEWLNCIKTQTETEPMQVKDFMEHSKINC